jgi:hypothetical protein
MNQSRCLRRRCLPPAASVDPKCRRSCAGGVSRDVTNLLFHTLSQGLQAWLPVAVLFVWLRATNARETASSVIVGLALSVPASMLAAAWFRSTTSQAQGEALLATAALLLVLGVRRGLLGRVSHARVTASDTWKVTLQGLTVTGTALLVSRQAMEILASLYTAAVELRSFEATAPIVLGAGTAMGLAGAWVPYGQRFAIPRLRVATGAFIWAYAAQLAFYAVHEFSEVGVLPWSEAVHMATEPYGPDGRYGVHFATVLATVPWLAIARTRHQADSVVPGVVRRRVRRRVWPALTLVAGVCFFLAGMQQGNSLVIDRVDVPAEAAALAATPHVLFRHTGPGPAFGHLAIVGLDAPKGPRVTTGLSCHRISFARNRGLCLHVRRGVFNNYSAIVLDEAFQPTAEIELEGTPSRTRTAADGEVGAVTVFVYGDDYAADFSTRTTVIDLASGTQIGELEQFSTWKNGVRIQAVDFNFWGVTFAPDSNTFYAALRPGGVTQMVRGDLARRRMTVLRENVECPSLSPDGRFLVYKKRTGPSPDSWRLHVLDAETEEESIIPGETRFVDDQVEWLDSEHVLYSVARRTTAISDVWVVSIRGGEPTVFLEQADSPIVVR